MNPSTSYPRPNPKQIIIRSYEDTRPSLPYIHDPKSQRQDRHISSCPNTSPTPDYGLRFFKLLLQVFRYFQIFYMPQVSRPPRQSAKPDCITESPPQTAPGKIVKQSFSFFLPLVSHSYVHLISGLQVRLEKKVNNLQKNIICLSHHNF